MLLKGVKIKKQCDIKISDNAKYFPRENLASVEKERQIESSRRGNLVPNCQRQKRANQKRLEGTNLDHYAVNKDKGKE